MSCPSIASNAHAVKKRKKKGQIASGNYRTPQYKKRGANLSELNTRMSSVVVKSKDNTPKNEGPVLTNAARQKISEFKEFMRSKRDNC